MEITTLIAAVVLAGGASPPADAAVPGQQPPAVARPVAKVSLDDAVEKVRKRYEGKVLRAETRRQDGRTIHYVKLLTPDGRVRTIRVDADTGRIL